MTSLERNMVPLDSIRVSKERFREDNGDIESLAVSILKFGQLEPIILDEDNELIAGFRRLSACRLNGADSVWAVHKGDVDDLLAREIELEENIQRKQMTPAEEVKAIAELHNIKTRQDPNWGQVQTAEATGVQRSQVSAAVKYAQMIDLFPELKEAKSIRQLQSWADAKAASIGRVVEVRDNRIDYEAIEAKILLGDSTEVIKQVPSETFHAIITDPPFGIDYDERIAGTIGSVSDYEDSSASYERLLGMAPDLFRVLRPNGWLIWFLGISWYQRAKEVFRASGFVVDEVPIIWDRSDGRSHTARPDRYMAKAYDIALHCIKGSPEMVQRDKPNVIRIPPVETATTSVERPVELYAELIRRLTVPGELVADFFVGSGSCPAACASLGRDYFGVEQDVERRAYALKKIRAHTPEGK